MIKWYLPESNRGHKDFQSFALPTELRYQPKNKNTIIISKKLKSFISIFFLLFFSLFSCSETKKEILKKKNRKEIPYRVFIRTSILYKEKGLVRFFIYSPIMEEYPIYTLFPNGLQLFLYEKGKDKYTYLSANWVKSTEKFFYHLKGNIIIMNPNGDFLKTEEIYWNKKRKKIFNNLSTVIYCSDGTILHAMNGLEASEDFKKIRLKNISGIFPI